MQCVLYMYIVFYTVQLYFSKMTPIGTGSKCRYIAGVATERFDCYSIYMLMY